MLDLGLQMHFRTMGFRQYMKPILCILCGNLREDYTFVDNEWITLYSLIDSIYCIRIKPWITHGVKNMIQPYD